MRWRALLGVALAMGALLMLSPARAGVLDPAEWELYKKLFVTAEGRVVDTGNGNVSHSEGQGYGLLLAVAFDDRETFQRLWAWTRQHLALREDGLLAWRWDERAPKGPVADLNNASDGDLLVAWALARGARRWHEPLWWQQARGLAQAVRTHVLRPLGGQTVLLPGQEGFVHGRAMTLNPSYWVFPALSELAELDPDPAWPALAGSGRALLLQARFGPARLPPDWLDVELIFQPSSRFPRVFGYNAIRIPLYLAWDGKEDGVLLEPFRKLWAEPVPALRAEVNLDQPEKATHPASAGMAAVAQLALYQPGQPVPAFPALLSTADYYAASLLLLTKLAYVERYAP